MTKPELVSRQEQYRRSDRRVGFSSLVFLFASMFGLMASLPWLGPEMNRSRWLGPVCLFGFLAFLIAQLVVLQWSVRRIQRKHGVVCPKCEAGLTGLTGQIALATGNCGNCGEKLLDDVDLPKDASGGGSSSVGPPAGTNLTTRAMEEQAKENYRLAALQFAPWFFGLGVSALCLSLFWGSISPYMLRMGLLAGVISIAGGLLTYHTTWKWAPWILVWTPTFLLWKHTDGHSPANEFSRTAAMFQFMGIWLATIGLTQWAFGLRLHAWMKAIQSRHNKSSSPSN